jgi:hypothetical protein
MIQVTITNTQSQATPAPFQVKLVLDLSSIISSASQLINLGFYLSPNLTNQIYAWIESYNSDFSQVVIWVNLPNGIPASSSVIVYICLQSSSQYPYTGMAPQLTPTYAQYDNGGNVFIDYWNFAGTSVPNGINVYQSEGTVTFNNGVTIKGGTSPTSGENGIATVKSYSPPIIIEYYGTQSTSPSGDSWGWNASGFSNWLVSSSTPFGGGTYTLIDFEGSPRGTPTSTPNATPMTTQGGAITGGTLSTPSNNLFPASVWTHIYTPSSYYTYQNYVNSTGYITGASNTASLPFVIMVGNNEASYVPNGMTVYWLRVRAYPPNGVDPTVTVGSSSTSTTSSSSNVQNEAFYVSQSSTKANVQNEALYIQQTHSTAQAQNEAFYIQQVSTKANVQNEALYIQPFISLPPKTQNEALYIQPFISLPPKVQNEAFFVKQVTISLPVQNEAFFIQQVQIKITHITIPEYIHFISIPQGYYNDLSLNIGILTELKLAQQYSFGISYNVTVSTKISTITMPTPQNVELDAIEVGIFIPALYFLGKKLYNKLIKRRKK